MGNKIPEHIDELIWRVAETRDADLTADFLRRYPNMRADLATREAMVDAMRGARPVPPIATQFAPTVFAKSRPKLWLAPLAAGLLIGLAIASYQVVKFNLAEPKEAGKKVVTVPESPIPVPPGSKQIQPRETNDSLYAPGTSPRPEQLPGDDGLVILKVNGASLFAALGAIRAKGVVVEIMPGLEDMPIALTANRDDGTIALDPLAMLQVVQTASGFKLVDAGPDGYMALPSEMTTVIDGDSRLKSVDGEGN